MLSGSKIESFCLVKLMYTEHTFKYELIPVGLRGKEICAVHNHENKRDSECSEKEEDPDVHPKWPYNCQIGCYFLWRHRDLLEKSILQLIHKKRMRKYLDITSHDKVVAGNCVKIVRLLKAFIHVACLGCTHFKVIVLQLWYILGIWTITLIFPPNPTDVQI